MGTLTRFLEAYQGDKITREDLIGRLAKFKYREPVAEPHADDRAYGEEDTFEELNGAMAWGLLDPDLVAAVLDAIQGAESR